MQRAHHRSDRLPARFSTALFLKKLLALFLIASGFCATVSAQMHDGKQLVQADLLANVDGIVPGKPFTVGLRLRMQPGWHTYWQYSGDSGMPTNIKCELPPGFKAGEIQWPIPEKTIEPGDLWTYAYHDEVLLLVEITPPAQIAEKQVTLKAHASWLVCEKICVPGNANVSVTLPISTKPNEENATLFDKYRAQLPKATEPPFGLKWQLSAKEFRIELSSVPPDEKIDFFPFTYSPDIIFGHPEKVAPNIIKVPFEEQKPGNASLFQGILVSENATGQRESWVIRQGVTKGFADLNNLLLNLLFGFLGGLILNIMPCVLPVIALKIFGFIKQAGESRQKIFRFGLAFVAGIFAWFFALAALIVAFKAAGHELNWAFQFQHPGFLIAMIVVIFVFALNLLGVFEIVLPGRAQTQVVDLAGREGYGGAFLHGVFATLMATPCTAPFLGPALGFALAQTAPIVFAMFGAIALGMSAPYFILAARPAWLSFLPKPGMWMVRVKQAMGVLLLGTVAWLGWVLWQQQHNVQQPFAPQLAQALKQNKIVFVDFTADWCVNCKVNERLVLDTEEVQRAFREHNVIFLKADWTNGDADITKLLKQFNRAGVPAYVVYPPSSREPVVLPEILKTQTVLEALTQAGR